MISKSVIDELLMRNDIESLIGGYVSLKRAGSNLKGLCPFHNEKSPSFTVYPADNSFYCFGCGIGGNAITFVRQAEHLDYPDAIEFLAKRAGIEIKYDDDSNYKQQQPRIKRDRLYKMNVDAAKFFNRMLFDNNPKSKDALAYFTEERRLSLSTIKHFGLGYAPDGYDILQRYMLSKGYTKEELFEGFLASKSDKGYYFDTFRNRVMFPIIDVLGNVIAFGGRVMDDSKPKYRNTMDTPVFKKSRNLFALNFAKQVSSEQLILCEGYMDVIALHAAGFTNAVATLGTAITAEQARLMKQYTKKVLISYDADEAGQKATQRAIKMLGEAGLDVGVIKVPGAKDPDEYIKLYGKEKFNSIISGSKSQFEYNMDSVLSKYDINLPQDRINALNDLEKIISEVYSKAERDIYIQSISKTLSVDFKSIRDDVERIIRKKNYGLKKQESEKMKLQAAGFSDRVNVDYAKAPAVANNEENVLGMLMLYPEYQKVAFEELLLNEDDFFTDFNKRIFCFLRDKYKAEDDAENFDINALFSTEEVSRVTKMKIARMNLENSATVFRECVFMLRNSIEKKKATTASTLGELDNLINTIRSKNAKG